MSTLHNADVDLGGLLAVLGSNLYSTPVVALRELVQNAHDSCTRRQIEDTLADPRITVSAEPSANILRIEDNGAGLTDEEIRRFLATLGAGYTRLLREESGSQELIGAFGLGFLSAYVVAERVVVETTSYQDPSTGWRFVSRDGQRYSLEPCEPRPVGTCVTLHLRQVYEELSQPPRVRAELTRYCALLRHPVLVPDQPVNEGRPPWHESGSAFAMKRRRMAFAERFEPVFKPLCTVDLGELPHGARGLAWVQDGGRYASSDNRRVTLFVRGMLISSDERELLPEWAGFCGAVIECDALVPTTSREDVKKDEVYRSLVAAVQQGLVEGLREVALDDPESWRRVLRRHNEALLGSALVDDTLFLLLEDQLRVPTSEGELTLAQVHGRSPDGVLASAGDSMGYQEVLYQALGLPVLDGTRYAVLPFAARWCQAHRVPLSQVGTDQGDSALFKPTSVAEGSAVLLQEALGDAVTQVIPCRFQPSSLPAVRVPDREVALKRRLDDEQSDTRIASGLLALARSYTDDIDDRWEARLYVNLESPVIARLLVQSGPRPAAVATVVRAVADLTCRERVGAEVEVRAVLKALTGALESLV